MFETASKNRLFSVVHKITTSFVILLLFFAPIDDWVYQLADIRFSPTSTVKKAEAAIVSAIKIESFDQNVTTDGSTFALTNDVGDISSAFIRVNTGTRKTSAGPTGSTANTVPSVGTVGLVLTDTNEVTVNRVSSTAVKVMGEVWRYEGTAGGQHEFIVRDRVAVSLIGTDAVVAVSGITDVDNVIPFVTGYTVNAGSVNDWDDATIAAHMDDSGNVVVSRNNSGTAATVYVDVVEFTGSAWTVCHGYSNAHNLAQQTITLNTDSDGVGGSTCDVNDWGTASIIEATMEGDTVETGISDTLALVRPGANTTSIVFDVQQDAAARNNGEAWIHVLQNDDMVVNRASNADIAEGNGTYGTASWPAGASTDADVDTLSLEWFTDSSGTGNAHMRGGLHARIVDVASTPSATYADNDTVPSTDYDSTLLGTVEVDITFAATPSGVIYEAGGTGTGSFVGYNDGGDFIIRAGNGASVTPADAARIVITTSDYDFSSRSGLLTAVLDPFTNSVSLSFDDGSNGSVDYATSTTAASAFANWSGGDDGGVGIGNTSIAGTEITSGLDFNGTISEARFYQGSSGGLEIDHWIHRSGNTVGVEYGVIELAGLTFDNTFFGFDTLVTATGTQITTADIPATDVYVGGAFVIQEGTDSRNVTSIIITESGTVDGATGLDDIELWYDISTSTPYNCSEHSFDGNETQFGSTDTNGFSGADGSSSFTSSVGISTTSALCVYPVMTVTDSASDGETINISINDSTTDVSTTGGGSVGSEFQPQTISGSTTLRNAELTQTHFRWLQDDAIEGSATAVEAEDTPATGFANGTINRLRMQVSAEGSTSSVPTTLRLEYATATAACSAVSGWTDVGAANGAWDMSNSTFITDGNDSSDLTPANGGTTNENTTHLSPNGALRDTSSTLSALTFATNNFLELEFAIEPTSFAVEGSSYCFRLTDAGTPLRNYSTYPQGTVSADITVSATSTHTASLDVGTTNQYLGGGFVIDRTGGNRTVTDITITEQGTVDAQNDLSNIGLWYDVDATAPHDCTGEAYDGDETQFGATSTSFSAADGTITFTGSETVGTNRTMCVYVVLGVDTTASNGETIQVTINNPSTDVVVDSSSVGPSTVVAPTGSTTIAGPVLTQTGYHWRNDDGDETDTGGGATSATGGSENTALIEVAKNTTKRLRIQIDNTGSVDSDATQYRLEYGTKIVSCDTVGTWNEVGVGPAFDLVDTANLTEGNDTNDIALASGGISNPGGSTFVSPNGGQRDITAQTGNITLTSTDYVELEFAFEATLLAGDETSYCFRVSAAGTELPSYIQYAELTTREKQDFYVQRGVATTTGLTTTLVAGVDYIQPASTSLAFIRITNTRYTGAGESLVVGNDSQTADGVTTYISNPENIGTSVDIVRASAVSNAGETTSMWEIVEFVGLAGTDNEMKVRDVGTVTYSTSELNATGTAVTGVSDDSDIVVFVTGQYNPDGSTGNYNDGMSTAFWHSTSSVPVFTRNGTGIAARVSYAVVEFTGANWKIQRVEHNYTSTSTETEAITAVTSPTQVFLHTQKRSGETGLHDIGDEVYVTGVGEISFQLEEEPSNDVDSPTLHDSVAWVIENTQTGLGAMSVYRSSGRIASGGTEPESNIYSIGGTVDPDNASIFANNNTTGEGAAFPRGILAARIYSPTEYELWLSDNGQNQDFRVEVVEWPVAEISVRQNYYRFYVDNDALTPTDPWPAGVDDLGENTSITSTNDPLGEGERVRIRMTLLINNSTLPAATKSYKLQFARRDSVCSALSEIEWEDLGDPGSGGVWRGYDATPVDGTEVSSTSLRISISDISGTYEEQNNSAVNPYAVDLAEDIEYDWLIEHNGAVQQSDYCFRMVESDGTPLTGYNQYPTIRTTGYTPVLYDWRWYGDETNETPTTALSATNSTPIDIQNADEIKLRAVVSEVEGAAGNNIKFKLQYSEDPTFAVGTQDVVAIQDCNGTSTWCYADGAGVDNALITTSVLATADSCVASVGNGCGTHNEFPETVSTLTQPANSNMEFEFTLASAGPRVNAVYYFRLYDVTNDDPLVASSSYPSLLTEGGSLTFALAGVTSGAVTEGVTTDVATTPTTIPFGSVPFDTQYEAAYRLTVDTNGTEGYRMFMFSTQDMLDSYGNKIEPISGTNAVPLPWTSGCSVLSSGCVGYHVGDDALAGGSTRFSPDDSYAAFSTTTPEEVMFSSQPTANESTDIIFKIQVTEQQPAGEYQKNVVFVSVPVF